MPIALLVILFVALPILELYVIIQVADALGGDALGAFLTILLLIADSLLGAYMMRSQGRQVWRRLTDTMRSGGTPTDELVDGALIVLGGVLLLTPGFVTDLFGLALLFPATRPLFARNLKHRLGSRLKSAGVPADGHVRAAAGTSGSTHNSGADNYFADDVVDSSAEEVDTEASFEFPTQIEQ